MLHEYDTIDDAILDGEKAEKERDDAISERDSYKAENEKIKKENDEMKEELKKTKELNFTLARQVSNTTANSEGAILSFLGGEKNE